MTELRIHPTSDLILHDGRTPLAPWQLVLIAPFAGAAVGAVARWWMRLITDDPEFSWNGTIFIVLAFAIGGTGHGVAWAARRAHLRRRWSTPARILASVLTLPIFVGAGAIMLPTVLGASLAHHRREWPRAARVVLALIALPAPAVTIVDVLRGGVTATRVLGLLLAVATYVAVVRGLGSVVAPIADGWRMARSVRILLAVALVAVVVLAVVSVVGVATAAP